MAKCSPSFNPASRAEILLRLHDGLQPGLKLLASVPNTSSETQGQLVQSKSKRARKKIGRRKGFSSPDFFSRRLRFFPAPTNCPWVSEDAPNMKLCAQGLRRIKMALRTRIVKIGALLPSQFGLLAVLNFQLFWMVTAYKMMELRQNLSLAAYLSARKTYLQRKRRYLQARRVHGFPNSLVLFNLICIEVDVLTLYLSFEIRETMNSILYFIA